MFCFVQWLPDASQADLYIEPAIFPDIIFQQKHLKASLFLSREDLKLVFFILTSYQQMCAHIDTLQELYKSHIWAGELQEHGDPSRGLL